VLETPAAALPDVDPAPPWAAFLGSGDQSADDSGEFPESSLAPPAGIEPATFGLGNRPKRFRNFSESPVFLAIS